MMLYASFAWLSGHWAPWLVLAWVWGGVFIPNMLRKEARLARHAEWASYTARTGFLLPFRIARAPRSAPPVAGVRAAAPRS